MVNWWFGARWFGYLGSLCERDCYLGVALESQTTNLPLVDLIFLQTINLIMLDMCSIIKVIESLSWICFFHAWKKVPNIFSQMVMYHDSKQTKYLKQIQDIQEYSHILPQWYIPLDTL